MNEFGYFSIIPAEVDDCERLDDGSKLLYGTLTSLAQRDGYCCDTNKYLAERRRVSESTVKRWIHDLAETGFIEIDTVKNGMLWDRKIYVLGVNA